MPNDEQEGLTAGSQGKPTTVVSIREGIQANTRTAEYSDPVPIDVREVWETVLFGIVEILRDTPQLTFRPEDVYADLVEERSVLFMSKAGWMVLTIEKDQFTLERTLLIWLAYTYEKGGSNWATHHEWLNFVALNEGCSYIEARSAVPELEPYAIKNGWEVETRVYRREVLQDGC